jgi:hypothetical protein
MSVVNKKPTLAGEIRDILSRLRKLETAPRLTSASIRGGTLRVLTKTGQEMLRLGDNPPNGDTEFRVTREDGTVALIVYNGGAGAGTPQYLAIGDRGGNIIMSDDTNSGQGIARPYVPMQFASLDMSNASGTQSATFVDLEQCLAYKQQPRVFLEALVIGDASTSGEFRLWDANHSVQIGSTFVLGAGAFTYAVFGPAAVSGNHLSTLDLRLQGRRTAGTGFVRARTVIATGMQS